MARVKIKHPNSTPKTKQQLLQILSINLVYATKIVTLNDGFIIITSTDEDLDKIFQKKAYQELIEEGFAPVLPPEIRAKRTVIIFNVEEEIKGNTENDIKEELINKNKWITDGIDNIYKFPKNNIMKICFNNTASATKALEKGLLAFHMSIPTYNIKKEEYIHINTCL